MADIAFVLAIIIMLFASYNLGRNHEREEWQYKVQELRAQLRNAALRLTAKK